MPLAYNYCLCPTVAFAVCSREYTKHLSVFFVEFEGKIGMNDTIVPLVAAERIRG